MKKCVVSFADKAGSYQAKMKRLEQSLKGNFDGDFLGFTDYKEIGCEPHSVIPYKFKPYAIQKAIDLGYEQILWCDSPIVAIKSIQPVFDHIEKHSYVFFDNIGHPLGKWTNQKALDHFKVTREEAMNVKMIMACCMGFDMSFNPEKYVNIMPYLFYAYKSMADSLYHGSWDNHRHDQTVMSFLLHVNKFNILTGQDTFFAYEQHYGVLPIANSVCLVSKG
jgi:aromatic ring-cleaving dioxygenase